MRFRLRSILYILLSLFLLPFVASAQTATSASISAPKTDAFPSIELYLDVHDSEGNFIHGLDSDQVFVLEDGTTIPISQLEEQRPGVQFVVAINPGSSFGVRNAKAVSRYDQLKEALRAWAKSRQGSTLDDWSLLITNGPTATHVNNPMEWLAALEADQVDARTATPSLDTLFRSITIATDPAARPGMERAVLFITPPPEGEISQSMESLIAQAKAQDVAIYIWMVASSGAFAADSVKQLTDLATQTGGTFFAFSGEEPLPNLEEYLEPLRSIYLMVYQSNISTSGAHQLSAQIQTESGRVETNVQTFELDIQPPQPAFVSPPIEVQRVASSDAQPGTGSEEPNFDLVPKEQFLQVVFDFPDGRKRPLVQTALLVDGIVVTENLSPPFDQFIWNLDGYNTTRTHQLQVQAKDALGLVGSSIQVPVLISVEELPAAPWSAARGNIPLLSGIAILLAGAFLLLVLVLGGRLRPKSVRASRSKKRKSDPVTQPVPVRSDPSGHRLSGWANRVQWPQRHAAPKAYAFLAQIPDREDQSTGPPIPISSEEVTLGSNPNQATMVIHDPSVEALHARLIRKEDGSFLLSDQGSIAGTWVNYTPISREGTQLEHGDLIHIGRVGFRFTLRQPSQTRKPSITLTASEENTVEESSDDSG